MNTTCIFISLALFACLGVGAQPIQPGQKIPQTLFAETFNYNKTTLDLNQYKNKVIIFDFWGINCISCIQAFPKLDSLQKKFNNNLQIILVSRESPQTLKIFFEKRKLIKIPDVPFICNDSILENLFPHKGFPVYAWLDAEHRYRFLTESADVNANSISKLINNEPQKLDAYRSGHYKTVNIFNQEHQESLLFTSTLTNCITGYQEPLYKSVRRRTTGINVKCASVTELYIDAFNENSRFNFHRTGRLITDFDEPQKYSRLNTTEWRNSHAYNYQLMIPASDSLLKYTYMKNDLQRYFHLTAEIKQVYKKCIVLEEIPGKLTIQTKSGHSSNTFLRSSISGDINQAVRVLQNKPFHFLTYNLSIWLEEKYQLPFECTIDYTGNIDLALTAEAVESLDFALLNKELEKYGLILRQKEMKIQCLTLTDKVRPVLE